MFPSAITYHPCCCRRHLRRPPPANSRRLLPKQPNKQNKTDAKPGGPGGGAQPDRRVPRSSGGTLRPHADVLGQLGAVPLPDLGNGERRCPDLAPARFVDGSVVGHLPRRRGRARRRVRRRWPRPQPRRGGGEYHPRAGTEARRLALLCALSEK
ncbi:unnamed protein product [Phaeothamnion confervicola]